MELAFIKGTRKVWGCFTDWYMPWRVLAVNIGADSTKEYNLGNKEKKLVQNHGRLRDKSAYINGHLI